MLTKDQVASIVPIETPHDLAEARLEAVGFVFHGTLLDPEAKRAPRGGANLLHFARCAKLDKATDTEAKFWYRSIKIAKQHLDQHVGESRWKWCKICEREITQKILNEA
jgi:hypothetical protein